MFVADFDRPIDPAGDCGSFLFRLGYFSIQGTSHDWKRNAVAMLVNSSNWKSGLTQTERNMISVETNTDVRVGPSCTTCKKRKNRGGLPAPRQPGRGIFSTIAQRDWRWSTFPATLFISDWWVHMETHPRLMPLSMMGR